MRLIQDWQTSTAPHPDDSLTRYAHRHNTTVDEVWATNGTTEHVSHIEVTSDHTGETLAIFTTWGAMWDAVLTTWF